MNAVQQYYNEENKRKENKKLEREKLKHHQISSQRSSSKLSPLNPRRQQHNSQLTRNPLDARTLEEAFASMIRHFKGGRRSRKVYRKRAPTLYGRPRTRIRGNVTRFK
jgi:hypothetical protein